MFPRWMALAIVLALMVAYTAGYAWSAPNTDSADELWHAYQIRHGISYPLEGPFLGGALHLGPFWFYLVALPLWFSSSWLCVAIFIGFLCSTKFLLAYHCGRVMLDRDFGVLWAVAMFIPGWSTIEPLVFLNPNAVAAATLGVLALCLRGHAHPMGPMGFGALGLAMGLAVHVHPTSIPIFILAVAPLWTLRAHGGGSAGALAALCAGFALPFAPYVVGQCESGFPDWASASRYVEGQVSIANIVNVPAILAAYAFTGPATMARYFLHWPGISIAIAGSLTCVAAFSSLAAIRSPGPPRLALAAFAIALLAFVAWIACARPNTPVQFTWVLNPVFGGLIALGARSLSRIHRLQPVIAMAMLASVAFNCWMMWAVARTVDSGEGELPATILDIKNANPGSPTRDTWFAARDHGALGDLLCSTKDAASLHGHLAFVIDRDLGLDTLLSCGRASGLVLAASDPPVHYLGMSIPFWNALGWEPDVRIGSLGLSTRAKAMPGRKGIAVADGSRYLPRMPATHPVTTATLDIAAPANAALLVTNVIGAYEDFHVLSATVDGKPGVPAIGNDLSVLYRPPDTTEREARWAVTIASTNLDAVDLVSLPPRGK